MCKIAAHCPLAGYGSLRRRGRTTAAVAADGMSLCVVGWTAFPAAPEGLECSTQVTRTDLDCGMGQGRLTTSREHVCAFIIISVRALSAEWKRSQ